MNYSNEIKEQFTNIVMDVNENKLDSVQEDIQSFNYQQIVELRLYARKIIKLLENVSFTCEGVSYSCERDRSIKVFSCNSCQKNLCSACFYLGSKYDRNLSITVEPASNNCNHKDICADCCSHNHKQ